MRLETVVFKVSWCAESKYDLRFDKKRLLEVGFGYFLGYFWDDYGVLLGLFGDDFGTILG